MPERFPDIDDSQVLMRASLDVPISAYASAFGLMSRPMRTERD
jgi:hypothetical protein